MVPVRFLRRILKRHRLISALYVLGRTTIGVIRPEHPVRKTVVLLATFFRDFFRYRRHNPNPAFPVHVRDLYPCIYDRTEHSVIDNTYFYQDTWCARKIFENKPAQHYDVGSKAEMVGIISQFTPTTMLDIRPIDVDLPGLSFRTADILQTGIPDNAIPSLSSMCVLEHIGLGRYGDDVNHFGSEQAFTEIKRILAPGGNLYISLPVDAENKVCFNAHRAFTRDYVLQLASPLRLVEERYIYEKRTFASYDPTKGFGTGLFHFRKI